MFDVSTTSPPTSASAIVASSVFAPSSSPSVSRFFSSSVWRSSVRSFASPLRPLHLHSSISCEEECSKDARKADESCAYASCKEDVFCGNAPAANTICMSGLEVFDMSARRTRAELLDDSCEACTQNSREAEDSVEVEKDESLESVAFCVKAPKDSSFCVPSLETLHMSARRTRAELSEESCEERAKNSREARKEKSREADAENSCEVRTGESFEADAAIGQGCCARLRAHQSTRLLRPWPGLTLTRGCISSRILRLRRQR
mmetsp:Transcript_59201/g.98007  ORF Transcript_59201/g.98007 Transcript_59201/m.98007 type:complete len:261 (+) Transcript_59201:142-924(+)